MKRFIGKSISIVTILFMLAQIISLMFIPVSAIINNETVIFNYLVEEMGLNIASATGILANIQKESSFRHNVIEYGYTWETGGGYGICQWTNYPRTSSTGRRTNLVNWCNQNGYDYSSLEGQLNFLKHEMSTSQLSTYNYLKSQPNSAEGSYESARYFCANFEKPANTTSVSQQRGALARDTYWPKYSARIAVVNKLDLYNPQAAAAYAEKWWDSFNPAYTNYVGRGGDCANFVSQCLYAGGLDYEESVWAPDKTAFIGCNSMKKYLTSIGGVFVENPTASDLDVGDIVYYYSQEKKCWGHVALVVKNNGTPYVAAHTTAQYTSNWKLGYSKVAVLKLTQNTELPAATPQISVTGAYSYDCSTTNEIYDISDKYFDSGNSLRIEWFDPNAAATSYRYKIIGLQTEPQPDNINESANALWSIGDGVTETTQNSIEIPSEKLENCLYIKIAIGCIDTTPTEKWKSYYIPISPNKPCITSHSNEEMVDHSSDLNITWSASDNATSYYVKAIQLTDEPMYNSAESHDNWGESGDNKYEKNTYTRNLTISADDLSPGKWIKIAICAKNSNNSTESWSQFFYLYVKDEPQNVDICFEKDVYEVPLRDTNGDPTPAFYVVFADLDGDYTTSWEIDNSNIAKINYSNKNECVVSAVSAGTTTLTVTVEMNGRLYEKSCTIKITDDEDEPTTGDEPVNIDIRFEKDVYEVPLRDTNGDPTPAFYVVFADLDGDYTTSWEIDNSNIAKINYSNKNECVVSAVSAGTTTLTATVSVNGRLYEKSCTIKITDDEDEPTIGDEPTGFTLSYDANGGSGAPASQSGASSYKVSAVQPVRSGYTFLGWSTDPNATSARYSAGSTISGFDNEHRILYAVWQENTVCSVNISKTYIEVVAPEDDDPFGGEQSDEIIISSVPSGNDIDIYVEDSSIATVSQVKYKGEDFYRVFVSGLKPGETYLVAEMTCDGSKYTAKSRIKVLAPEIDEPTGFTLIYDANGGSGAPASQSGALSYLVSSVQPVRNGYTFLGWSTDRYATSAGYVGGNNINISDNTVLYAVWKVIEVAPKTAISCRIISEPAKTNYIYLGAMQADLTGLILEITYSDGTKETVNDTTELVVKGFDTTSVGNKIVTVEYSGVSAQFNVNVSYTWWQWIIRILLFGWLWY